MNLLNSTSSCVTSSPSALISARLRLTIVCNSIRPSAGSRRWHLAKNAGVPLLAEVLERPDADDPVDRLVELLPPLQADLDLVPQVGQPLAGQVVLLLAEGQPDGPSPRTARRPGGWSPPSRTRCRAAAGRASGRACPGPGRSWPAGPVRASRRPARSRRSYTSSTGRGTGRRSRSTGRSGPGPACRTAGGRPPGPPSDGRGRGLARSGGREHFLAAAGRPASARAGAGAAVHLAWNTRSSKMPRPRTASAPAAGRRPAGCRPASRNVLTTSRIASSVASRSSSR